MLYYWYQGERLSNREATKSASVVMKSGLSKKNVKNPLTNRPSCDTIRVQNIDGVRRLRGVCQKATPLVRVEFSHLWLVSLVESVTQMMWVRVPPPAKKLKKVLDKPRTLCYNKGTKRGCNDRTSAEQECNLPNAPRSDDGE